MKVSPLKSWPLKIWVVFLFFLSTRGRIGVTGPQPEPMQWVSQWEIRHSVKRKELWVSSHWDGRAVNVRVLFSWPEVSMKAGVLKSENHIDRYFQITVLKNIFRYSLSNSITVRQTCEHNQPGVYTYSRPWMPLQIMTWRAEANVRVTTASKIHLFENRRSLAIRFSYKTFSLRTDKYDFIDFYLSFQLNLEIINYIFWYWKQKLTGFSDVENSGLLVSVL